jgi:SAM-dependent methyltransferase
MRAPAATAHNVRLVDWAPNHVRAWTRAAYDRVGGHDASMRVADDHDLVVRMFLAGARFAHVPRCLYLYRVHADNTVRHENAAIRAGTWRVYERSVWALAERWARERDLARVDLCGGVDSPDGYVRVDRDLRGGDGVECDLDGPWQIETSSVGILRAMDAIEHLRDPVHTMNEAHRVLAPGGFFMISVPSTTGTVRVEGKDGPVDVTVAGRGADCDPTHVSRWNKLSFRYYTDPAFARYVPSFRGRFQVGRVLEWFPSDWHREEGLPYVDAQLFAVKDGCRPMGDLLWPEPSETY